MENIIKKSRGFWVKNPRFGNKLYRENYPKWVENEMKLEYERILNKLK